MIHIWQHKSSLTWAKEAACRAQAMHGDFLENKGLSCS